MVLYEASCYININSEWIGHRSPHIREINAGGLHVNIVSKNGVASLSYRPPRTNLPQLQIHLFYLPKNPPNIFVLRLRLQNQFSELHSFEVKSSKPNFDKRTTYLTNILLLYQRSVKLVLKRK